MENFENLISLNHKTSKASPTRGETETHLYDAVVIGSGPAGYTAALYLGRAGYAPLLIAGALTPGGQLVNTTEVENFPGFPEGILGPDLMENMRKQAEKFGTTLVYDDVTETDLSGTIKTLTTDSGTVYRTRTVIIATGSSYRKLGIPGEEQYSGRGVSYCATCDGFFFKDKPIVVVGGGDTALTDALFLSRFGSSVTLIHRRDTFRGSQILVERAQKNPRITFVLNSTVSEVKGDGTSAQSVIVHNTQSGKDIELAAKGVFIAIGYTPQTKFLDNNLSLDDDGYILVDGETTKTSIPGVFAAGDAADRIYRQAISAAGMGCRAALDAQSYLENL